MFLIMERIKPDENLSRAISRSKNDLDYPDAKLC